jgi:hypothetical protein
MIGFVAMVKIVKQWEVHIRTIQPNVSDNVQASCSSGKHNFLQGEISEACIGMGML